MSTGKNRTGGPHLRREARHHTVVLDVLQVDERPAAAAAAAALGRGRAAEQRRADRLESLRTRVGVQLQ